MTGVGSLTIFASSRPGVAESGSAREIATRPIWTEDLTVMHEGITTIDDAMVKRQVVVWLRTIDLFQEKDQLKLTGVRNSRKITSVSR